jgi:hypothetical protein
MILLAGDDHIGESADGEMHLSIKLRVIHCLATLAALLLLKDAKDVVRWQGVVGCGLLLYEGRCSMSYMKPGCEDSIALFVEASYGCVGDVSSMGSTR